MQLQVHKPRNPRFEERVRESFGRQPAMQTLHAEISELVAGRLTLTMPFRPELTQQHGFVHAGIVTTLLDTACGFAAFSLMDEEAAVLTVEFKTSLLAPAAGRRFRATGEVIKSGRTLTFCEGQAVAEGESEPVLIATMTATLMAIQGRENIRG